MMPSCDQIGVPIHFHSSTTSGSASLMSLRILLRVSPRQSPSSAILFEMSSDGDWPRLAPDFFMFSSSKFQIYLICKTVADSHVSSNLAHISTKSSNPMVTRFALSREVVSLRTVPQLCLCQRDFTHWKPALRRSVFQRLFTAGSSF